MCECVCMSLDNPSCDTACDLKTVPAGKCAGVRVHDACSLVDDTLIASDIHTNSFIRTRVHSKLQI